jgi:hypothetical protein
MRALRNRPVKPDEEPGLAGEQWETFGVDPSQVTGWKAIGFGPFEAAMAQGDGYTPLGALHYERQLSKVATSWARVGLDTSEGLGWHRAGFAAKNASQLRAFGVDLGAARARRTGY